jgi:glucose-1-phosphate cytidylyltransferase
MMAKDPMVGHVDLQMTDSGNDAGPPKPQIAEFSVGDIAADAWVVILAGGKGSRLSDKTDDLIPKPMVEVGGAPMLEHVMRIYSAQGLRRFIIATGHKREVIEDWVENNSETLAEFADEVIAEDTGEDTQTAGRLLRLSKYLKDGAFFMTYGDGFADVNMRMLVDHHRGLKQPGLRKPTVTLSAVHPPSRFGNLTLELGRATVFGEKTQSPLDWINGGFYIIEPQILNMISGDDSRLEYDVLPALAIQKRIGAYQHPGFFQMVDTQRDLTLVNQMVEADQAPWMLWRP